MECNSYTKHNFNCLQGLFPPGQGATIGVDFMVKTLELDKEKVKVGLYRCDASLVMMKKKKKKKRRRRR